MGGCCCCLSKDLESPRASEEAEPLSLPHDSVPAVLSGLLVNANLETSVVNPYVPPPVSAPNNVAIYHSQAVAAALESGANKRDLSAQTTNSVSVEELVRANIQENAEIAKDPKLSEYKDPIIFSEKENQPDVELLKNVDQVIASTEECPTCLEEYDEDNPKIITKCDHHFHLGCILEWMERSDTCPVCSKEMAFSPLID
ncbi:hypothetical protein MLD38_036630 [Melastoma candidum]|uniref:Uncharacterized protein n=1 Tax=Melastoma candidum TaxID=119954 RepID=A0ACB9LKI9_9MYRT|nr:hypothetical protein MLD38_036630 [Melastoma candidum]